jgi:electron transfer flavoprotein alpha/beta subunit
VHCQRSLSTALSTGVDRARLIEAYAALDARATTAAISAIRFRVHRFQFGVRIIIA